MKSIFLLVTFLLSTVAYTAEVVTWVPAYSINQSYEMLNKDFGGVGMKDGLSRLALQFWQPTSKGGLAKETAYGNISDADIKKFSDWGDQHHIDVLLCIYNPPLAQGAPWNWPLAQSAFKNPDLFVDSILQEIDRLAKLDISVDGVDMDLESSAEQSAKDRDAYLKMMKLLSKKLKAAGKKLTVATYATKFNAPNVDYWPKLTAFVDGITPMGYENIGYQVACEKMWNHSDNWCAYDSLIAASAPLDKSMLTLGMPGNVNYESAAEVWKGRPLLEHLRGAQALGAGVAIWDANLHPAWQKAEVWKTLKAIKNGTPESSASIPVKKITLESL